MTQRSKRPVLTGGEQVGGGREKSQFKPGQSGNPAGRPKGSRSKLNEDFIAAYCADFEKHGARVIAKVRTTDPATYLRVAANLLPKEFNVSGQVNHRHDHNAVGLSATAAFIAEALGAGPNRAPAKPVSH